MDDFDDLMMLSGNQHFAFCPRQWALIHIEQQWAENARTIDGGIFHERTHSEAMTEKRGNVIITRGMRVISLALGITGQCDVVEFHMDPEGIVLHGYKGKWRPHPIEYKKEAQKKMMQTGSSFAHKQCALKKCWLAVSLQEVFFMGSRGGASMLN
jgi:CRISPR-associated exonuclease Cas4